MCFLSVLSPSLIHADHLPPCCALISSYTICWEVRYRSLPRSFASKMRGRGCNATKMLITTSKNESIHWNPQEPKEGKSPPSALSMKFAGLSWQAVWRDQLLQERGLFPSHSQVGTRNHARIFLMRGGTSISNSSTLIWSEQKGCWTLLSHILHN